MAKAGMRRPSPDDSKNHGTENRSRNRFSKNEEQPVPEFSGKVKTGKKKAKPL